MKKLLLALLLLPGLAVARPLAFVINSAEASVSLIDMDTRAELKRIPVLREPHHMALTPDGASLLVGDTAGNALFFLDPATGDVQRRMTLSDPYQLQYSPNGKWMTVAGLARNQIDIYDAATLTLAHRIPASSMPSHINYSPDSSVAYVSLQGTDSLMAIDVRSGAVLWEGGRGQDAGRRAVAGRQDLVGIMGSTTWRSSTRRRGRWSAGCRRPRARTTCSSRRTAARCMSAIAWTAASRCSTRRRWPCAAASPCPAARTTWTSPRTARSGSRRRWAHTVAVLDPATGQFSTIETGRSPHGIWLNTHPNAPTPTRVSAK